MNKNEKVALSSDVGSGGFYAPTLIKPASRKKPGALCFALAGTAVIPFVAFGAGTGSIDFDCHAKELWPTGACYIVTSTDPSSDALAKSRLENVKKSLQITTTDLARFLLVERPSVYQWFAGTEPRQKNLERINALSALATDWSVRGLGSLRPYLKHRSGEDEVQLDELLQQHPFPETELQRVFDELTTAKVVPVSNPRPSLSDRLVARGFEPVDETTQARKRVASVRSVSPGEE